METELTVGECLDQYEQEDKRVLIVAGQVTIIEE